MFSIEEVKSKKQMKQFVDFANNLYKNAPQYVPPFYGDELALRDENKNPSLKHCKARFWMCKDENGKVVGRIAGILVPDYNKYIGKNYIRFTRYDVIDNVEVSKLLFNEIYKFAREEGMDTVHGPLGFNDFEREGLVVDGFQYTVTSSNEYNYPYYMKHLEALGFVKQADWLEYRVLAPDAPLPNFQRLSDLAMSRYGLREATTGLSTSKVIKRYGRKIFALLNDCYGKLHGYVQITPEVEAQLIKSFTLAINAEFISLVVDKDDNLVALGVALSSLSHPLQKCGGKLFPFGFIPMLRTLKHPETLELAFIAVKEQYRDKGVMAICMNKIMISAARHHITYAETNSVLEYNAKMRTVWEKWDHVNHRRRRCYVLEQIPKE